MERVNGKILLESTLFSMTHVLFIEYPYFTVKRFYTNLEEAKAGIPPYNQYLIYMRLLNARIYELKDYLSDSKYTINFDTNLIL